MSTAMPSQSIGDERGRNARHPGAIPAKGWRDILWRVYQESQDDRLLMVAAAVTFYSLLALVPALAALVSLYSLVSDPQSVQSQVQSLQGILPEGALSILREQLVRLSSEQQSGAGFAFFISLGIALWSANAGTKSIIEALNIVYDEEDRRSFIKLNLVSLSFTLLGMVTIILFLLVMVAIPAAMSLLNMEGWWVDAASFALLFVVTLAMVSCLFRWGPYRQTAKWRWVTPGAAIAVLLVVALSVGFSWYTRNFGTYNATYGSLGALIGFMTWLWISMLAVLIGAEVDAEMEHQTAHDSTVDPKKPLGHRGARMADTVGVAHDSGRHSSDDAADGSGRDVMARRANGIQQPRRNGAQNLSVRSDVLSIAAMVGAAAALTWMARRA